LQPRGIVLLGVPLHLVGFHLTLKRLGKYHDSFIAVNFTAIKF
jgi:hypothetical protein